jgi:hypothetical protein
LLAFRTKVSNHNATLIYGLKYAVFAAACTRQFPNHESLFPRDNHESIVLARLPRAGFEPQRNINMRPEPKPRRNSFWLQNQLIFETIPLTAEAPVSRPRWLGSPDCP